MVPAPARPGCGSIAASSCLSTNLKPEGIHTVYQCHQTDIPVYGMEAVALTIYPLHIYYRDLSDKHQLRLQVAWRFFDSLLNVLLLR